MELNIDKEGGVWMTDGRVVVDVNLRFHAIFQSSAHVSRSPGDHNSPTMVLKSKLSKEGYYLIILLFYYLFISFLKEKKGDEQ